MRWIGTRTIELHATSLAVKHSGKQKSHEVKHPGKLFSDRTSDGQTQYRAKPALRAAGSVIVSA